MVSLRRSQSAPGTRLPGPAVGPAGWAAHAEIPRSPVDAAAAALKQRLCASASESLLVKPGSGECGADLRGRPLHQCPGASLDQLFQDPLLPSLSEGKSPKKSSLRKGRATTLCEWTPQIGDEGSKSAGSRFDFRNLHVDTGLNDDVVGGAVTVSPSSPQGSALAAIRQRSSSRSSPSRPASLTSPSTPVSLMPPSSPIFKLPADMSPKAQSPWVNSLVNPPVSSQEKQVPPSLRSLGSLGSQNLIRLPTPAASQLDSTPTPAASESPPSSHLARMRARMGQKNLAIDVNKTRSAEKVFFRVLEKGERFTDYYDLTEEIYSGGARGKVVLATRRSDRGEVAIKVRSKKCCSSSEMSWREVMVQLQKMRGSRHVLDILEILEDDVAFYVVMPRCNGGELFDFLITETEIPESECKRILREILIAVRQLHLTGLVHRDIKPENIMFNQDQMDLTSPKSLTLIDFDTCMEFSPKTPKSTKFVGTPGYIAPEALLGQITPQSDLWSVGVIFYILMTGALPWSTVATLEDGTVGSKGATRMYHSIMGEQLSWDEEPWPSFPDARDLCQKMLSFDLEERPTSADEVLDHPWLRQSDLTDVGCASFSKFTSHDSIG